MIPKKFNILFKPLSEELNISESLIDDLISFYYKDIRINLSNLSYPRINVIGLGQFVVKNYYIQQTIPRLQKKLLDHNTYTLNAYFNKKQTENKLESLLQLQIKINNEVSRKLIFIKNKYNESIKKNLEE